MEPTLRVGLQWDVLRAEITLEGPFTCGPKVLGPGHYQVIAIGPDRLDLHDVQGKLLQSSAELTLVPQDSHSVFALEHITIGRGFHWQREERERFEGHLRLRAQPTGTCLVLNEIPLESYLASVISSEMNPRSPLELLKAHAMISRSWIVAQLRRRRPIDAEMATTPQGRRQAPESPSPSFGAGPTPVPSRRNVIEIVRWTDRESHSDFDVCADDHCQRYRGIGPITQAAVQEAVQSTHGLILACEGDVADTRFSKCCGGMTEAFSTAWQDRDIPYLRGGCFDGERLPPEFPLPLTEEAHARLWIESQPPAYCSLADPALREMILPDSDRDTQDFFRWQATIAQDELRQWIRTKLGCDIGAIRSLEPLQRGVSGR
ncbi:MAG TPA: SpoIID/LytB domain-containing protein, partial [Blastocatellia bacterium]|nr:SpoIID/LytB domain-containing protein [Blastocatellia bacterium]